MRQQTLAPEPVLRTYLAVMHKAILNARARIRHGESIDLQEVHDLLDAIHNIPEMLCAYGGWHVEPNIDADLSGYDQRWCRPDSSSLRSNLLDALERARSELPGDSPSLT